MGLTNCVLSFSWDTQSRGTDKPLFGVFKQLNLLCWAGPRSAVGNVSGYRCVSDCRSRGREFDPGHVPYFRGDWSWNYFYGHSPPFHWFIQEGLLSVTSESMCMNYWLTACSACPGKSVVRWTDRPAMTLAVDLGRKANKPTTTIKLWKINNYFQMKG